jgi:hypothetical protein
MRWLSVLNWLGLGAIVLVMLYLALYYPETALGRVPDQIRGLGGCAPFEPGVEAKREALAQRMSFAAGVQVQLFRLVFASLFLTTCIFTANLWLVARLRSGPHEHVAGG